MSDNTSRRTALKMFAAMGLGGFATAAQAGSIGAIIPGKGWVISSGEQCTNDGTPLQFLPKNAPDASPLDNELSKYPKCPYCGMDRTKFNHSRHLVHYSDDLVDGTCSIHCMAISLSLNIDRGTKGIYAPDRGSSEKIKPMVNVDEATYLVGSKIKGTMTANSKAAYASTESAKAAQKTEGGELMGFDGALKAAYLDMANDTILIRKRRAKRREKMMKKMKQA